jgi:hypothetical protein
MKTTRIQLESTNARLATENEAMTLAISDLCNGAVKWFGHSREFEIGISRPAGAAGGIAIVRQCGCASAHYFETYARETLKHIAMVMTSGNDEHTLILLRQRAAIEAAQAYVSEAQRAA